MPEFADLLRQPLASGPHKDWDGEQCIMERVSLLWAMASGQDPQAVFSDLPACTNQVVARVAQVVNDRVSDEDRQRLNAFLPRLLRCRRTETDRRINVRLAIWCARRVLHLVRPQDRRACEKAIEAAEAWLADPSEENAAAHAHAAYAAHATAHAAYAANAAYAAANAAYAAYAAHAAHAAYAARAAARAAEHAARAAADLIPFLDELLDAWEEAVTKEGHDLYVPREWEDAALAFVAEMEGEP